ncbi:MAG TPA: hypothetical protein DDZ76_03045 [Xanthomonadales bacterium]|nr:hypothetical protein [Xanthomonadales bacterium]
MLDLATAQLGLNHIQCIVRALHDLANTDGLHATEEAMIQGFYALCRDDAHAPISYDELVREPFDPAQAAEVFDAPASKAALLHSCLLLAYADGVCSAAERARIATLARALGVSDADLAVLEEQVRDHLIQQIAHIENVDALRDVARELGERS